MSRILIRKLQTNFPANQTISTTHLSNLIDTDILLDFPLFAYPRLVMRAFNSFCGLRRFAALNPHLARNTIGQREDASPIDVGDRRQSAAVFSDQSMVVWFSVLLIAKQSEKMLPAALN